MSRLNQIVADLQQAQLKTDIPNFSAGDTVKVHVLISDGEKERIQMYEGVVIQRRGQLATETFTVRKISKNVGVERIFPIHSPVVTKIEVIRKGRVRRARIFFLRDRRGKSARIKQDNRKRAKAA